MTFFVAEYTTPKTKVKLKSDMEAIATASETNDTYVLTEPPPEQQAG